MSDVRQHANPNTVITVIGNKSDLDNKRQVSKEEGERFARENGLFFMEASAKSAENVEEAFVKTAETIYKKIQKGEIDLSSEVCSIEMPVNFQQFLYLYFKSVEWNQISSSSGWFVPSLGELFVWKRWLLLKTVHSTEHLTRKSGPIGGFSLRTAPIILR